MDAIDKSILTALVKNCRSSYNDLARANGISLNAIKKTLTKLNVGGLLTVVFYEGHQEGFEEKQYIYDQLCNLDEKAYHVVSVDMVNQTKKPPSITFITKK